MAEQQTLLTTAEVATALGVSKRTIAWRAEHGHLPYAAKAPGRHGAYLFDPAVIETSAA